MKPIAYDFKEFYATPLGQVVARAVHQTIKALWPDMTGRRVMVFGFAEPYADLFTATERHIFLMPPEQGAYPWPEGAPNRVVVSARTALPLETNSLDGVILIHALEFTNAIEPHLDEIWRVLKGQGRLIVIVPNRLGFWSRVDWAPFGHGTPFSLSQMHRYLRDAKFIPERHVPMLFTPPLRWRFVARLAPYFEKYLAYVFPTLAGLHGLEASKQVYAGLALPVKPARRVTPTVLAGAGDSSRRV
jgi:SAM-dependent methyltransferase